MTTWTSISWANRPRRNEPRFASEQPSELWRYELNIFGELSKPAAVQIGAMAYIKLSAEARSNCVNLICSVLANADYRQSSPRLELGVKGHGEKRRDDF